jgi:hypothetical protein
VADEATGALDKLRELARGIRVPGLFSDTFSRPLTRADGALEKWLSCCSPPVRRPIVPVVSAHPINPTSARGPAAAALVSNPVVAGSVISEQDAVRRLVVRWGLGPRPGQLEPASQAGFEGPLTALITPPAFDAPTRWWPSTWGRSPAVCPGLPGRLRRPSCGQSELVGMRALDST